jgi:nucleotide-binding universal stress UspA family protein
MIKNILLCLDGEEHSQKAQEYAISLAESTHAHITALHVENPYLKQFHHEIYATGRREYVAYVDNLLQDLASKIERDFAKDSQARGINSTFISRHGVPLEEIVKEAQQNNYDLVVVGGKQLRGLEKYKSGNLPEKLQKILVVPLLTVKKQ